MAYNINWFANNMRAVLSSNLGACSFCCLRNLNKDVYCDKLQCFDCETGKCVFWNTKISGHNREILMGKPPREMIEWFVGTSKEYTKKISGGMIKKLVEQCR